MTSALLIEDTALIRKLLATVLSKGGFRVIESSHGGEAFDKINQEVPDIIICDLEMPVMDGRAFVKQFRSDPNYQQVPLVILSADSDDGMAKELLNIGATRIIDKAVSPQEIVEILKKIVAESSFNSEHKK